MGKTTNSNPLNRREFLKYASATGLSLALSRNWAAAQSGKLKPNILFIMTDEQHISMMSHYGNKYLKTPAMDSLAASGMSFMNTYVTNPVCVPSRVSLQTGVMPSAIGMSFNDSKVSVPKNLISNSLGALLKNAGYECGYGGKVHLPAQLQNAVKNDLYDYFCADERDELAVKCAEFVKRKRTKPFFLFASFINPHDICYITTLLNAQANTAADSNSIPKDRNGHPIGKPNAFFPQSCIDECEKIFSQVPVGAGFEKWVEQNCPPLPDNFEIPADEPQTLTSKMRTGYKKHIADKWTALEWRLHRWFYCRLTEVADAQIGQVLKALRDSGQEDNTIIIFTSDHGDMDASHKLENKEMFYDEAVRVPFIFSYKGLIKPGRSDTAHLVSNGLDLLPTVCDMIDIKQPENLPGRSLKPLLLNKPVTDWRDYIVIESHYSRMVCDDKFKYSLYEAGKNDEMLIDLKNDPGEMHNLAYKKEYQSQVESYRAKLKQWAQKTNDKVALSYLEKLQQPSNS